MQVSEMRSKIASIVRTTDDNLRMKQQRLYRQPSLRDVLPGRHAAGSDREGLLATPAATALVMLTAMTSGHREMIGPTVVSIWGAPLVANVGKPVPVIKLAGAALTALLLQDKFRSRLDWLELDQNVPEISFVWRNGRRTIFAPFTPDERDRRVAEVSEAGLSHAVKLPSVSVEKIAGLLKTEPSALAAS